ncbi:amidohydrolase family protein [Candidatus Bathyarchaeota archaeon]|nr:amidohydrolase family protein [Candidatus Bathyarchaeota archaeon]
MGDALTLPESTLSHSRAVRQLADLHRCEPTWEAVVSASESKRATGTYDAWIGTCLSDIETVVVDDALKDTEDMHSFTDMSVSVYTRSPCWRVVRVESVVEAAVEQLAARGTCSFAAVSDRVTKEFMTAMHDPHVVGFKSVIGKFSEMDYHTVKSEFETLLSDYLGERKRKGSSTPFRLNHAAVAQYFVEDAAILLCSANKKLPTDADRPPKVFQFHTGLGDNDSGVSKASPLHLQGFIYEYPTTPIVILYAGYPFTREAAYLANTYSNVWVDVGGLFPYLSRRGQENAVHELLELAPWSKILAGTGGGYFPETYHLAQTQVKEVLETVRTYSVPFLGMASSDIC